MRCLPFFLLAGVLFAQSPNLNDLIRQLGDDDFNVREKAATLLQEQGEKARAVLIQAAKESTDAEIRKRSADLLADLNRTAARRALAQRFEALRQLSIPTFDPKQLKPIVEKKGALTEKEVWGPDRTYLLTANTSLTRGADLTILPGTVVLLGDGVDFLIQPGASLTVSGEADRPVILTSEAESRGKPGHWGIWRIASESATLRHVHVRRGAGVRVEGRSTTRSFEHIGIYHTRGDALTLQGRLQKLDNLTVHDATGVGLTVDGIYPALGKLTLSRCRTGALLKGGAYPTLSDLSVVECKEAGIQVKDGSYPTLDKCLILEGGTGLRVSDGAYPRVGNLILGNPRGDGVLIEGGSYPSLTEVEITGAEGVGLRVLGGSYPYLGVFKASDCKKGDQEVEPGSRLQPLRLERLRSQE